MGYFGYVGSKLIPNSLGLGREVVLIGVIQPGFFHLPNVQGEMLGVPLYSGA
jgi:hypothetical protein